LIQYSVELRAIRKGSNLQLLVSTIAKLRETSLRQTVDDLKQLPIVLVERCDETFANALCDELETMGASLTLLKVHFSEVEEVAQEVEATLNELEPVNSMKAKVKGKNLNKSP
jgi:hypothetical protein